MTSQVMADHVRHLQGRLAAKEVECTLLAAHNRKLEEALRPFAELYRSVKRGEQQFPWDPSHWARIAELVPEEATSPPPSEPPSPAAPHAT